MQEKKASQALSRATESLGGAMTAVQRHHSDAISSFQPLASFTLANCTFARRIRSLFPRSNSIFRLTVGEN